ncbi:MAG: prepilin peptidase [Myxococcales bacterium]|nr:prepilin peptidase [Myxococcales bacterium]
MLVSEIPSWLLTSVAFAFGAAWGSFFNVAIYRWPRGLSVVTPPSHCPACDARIPAYLNVPIFGYLALRGRTACCGAPLSPRYPVVEVLGAALGVAIAQRYIAAAPPETLLLNASLEALAYFVFAGGLLVATFVDLEWMEIPDEVSLPGAALGLVSAPLRGAPGVEQAALGAGGGFLFIQMLFVWGYERLTGRRGMGEGDSKLLMMIGAFEGPRGAAFALFAGAAQGLLVAIYALLSGKQLGPDLDALEDEAEQEDEHALPSEPPPAWLGHLKLPFGPFLALGALEYLFFGERAIEIWFGFVGSLLPGG